jgi:hypothetical protein
MGEEQKQTKKKLARTVSRGFSVLGTRDMNLSLRSLEQRGPFIILPISLKSMLASCCRGHQS